MGAPVTYPDGSTLTSSALTIQGIGAVLQPIICGMLGITDTVNTSMVRIEYGKAGQPYLGSTIDDVCYFRVMPASDPYTQLRETSLLAAGDAAVIEETTFTNVWALHFCLYGPNSYDRARAIRSAFYMEYFTDQLAQSQLFPVSAFPEPVRAPELYEGQWFERVDMEFTLYEFVVEDITRQTVDSVEVILANPDGQIADIVIEPDEIDGGPFSGGQTKVINGGPLDGGQTLVLDGGTF